MIILSAICGALVIVTIAILATNTVVVAQSEVIVVERLGKFHTILYPGVHFLVPFVDQIHKMIWTYLEETPGRPGRPTSYTVRINRIDLRESVYDFPSQKVITRDNVILEINALLYFQITDPKRAVYEVANLPLAIEKLTQTTLRNVVGSMDLDHTLTSRDEINTRLREILDEASDKWGVKVNRVELQEIIPPADIRAAMEKQMRAERNRRAQILEAEGEKQSKILSAEGERQSQIERANGQAEAAYLVACGERRATVERALGDAQAMAEIQKVLGSEKLVQYLVATRYISTLPEVLKGQEGKTVVLPYETASSLGAVAAIGELLKSK